MIVELRALLKVYGRLLIARLDANFDAPFDTWGVSMELLGADRIGSA